MINIKIVPNGHWEGKKYVCDVGSPHDSSLVDGWAEKDGDVTRHVKCSRGGWHQVAMPEDMKWRTLPLWLRRLRATFTRNPMLSNCNRCWADWDHVQSRSLDYAEGRGCFFLCTACWNQTTLTERLHYGHKSWEKYWQHEVWSTYEQAIKLASLEF